MTDTPSSIHSSDDSAEEATAVIGSGTSGRFNNASLSKFSWHNPLLLVIVAIVAVLGVYLIVSSSAATVTATKVWSSAADWNTGTLSSTAVIGNSVSLLPQVTTTTTTSAPVNLALKKSAFASSSYSASRKTTELSAKYVNDGSLTTRWSSKYSDPQSIYIDLGKTSKVSEVKLYWQDAYATSYKIQTSNDARNWTTVYSTTTGKGGVNDLTDLNGSGRYVRMYGIKRATSLGYSLWEMQVYGPNTSGAKTTTTTTTYPTSGAITVPFDAGTTATWTSLTGLATLPTGTGISYQVRASSDNSTWSAWTAVPANGSLSGITASRYIQVQAKLTTNNSNITPTLTQLALTYSLPVASPTVSLTATPTQITAGQSTMLSWSSTNTTSCTASGSWSGAQATSGAATVSPTTTATYNLSCSGSGGMVNATPVIVTVSPATSSGGGGGGGGSSAATWVGDFASGTTQGWFLQACPGPTPAQGVTIGTAPAGSGGQYVAAFTVADNSTSTNPSCAGPTGPPTPNPRAQLVGPNIFQNNSNWYIGFSTYFPANFPTPTSWFGIAEIYGKPWGGSPSMGFGVHEDASGNAELTFTRDSTHDYDTVWTAPLVRGQWINEIVHVQFSTCPTPTALAQNLQGDGTPTAACPTPGYVELWLNGVQQQFKVGPGGASAATSSTTRLYYDTLVPNINWDGSTPNNLTLHQYRDVNAPLGTVTLYHAEAKAGPTYNSVLP